MNVIWCSYKSKFSTCTYFLLKWGKGLGFSEGERNAIFKPDRSRVVKNITPPAFLFSLGFQNPINADW